MSFTDLVIVGGGQAGLQTAVSLRGAGYDGRIRIVGEEPYLPYQRPPLSKAYLKRQANADSVRLRPEQFFSEQRIEWLPSTRIASIDLSAQILADNRGGALSFDRLVLATGVRPRKLGVSGNSLEGVHYLRTIADADALLAGLGDASSIVIIGGGFIGLEAAACFAGMGKRVVVLEGAPRVMARAVAPFTSEFFLHYHRSLGIDARLDAKVARLCGAGKVQSVELEDGTQLPCDLVLVGIGALPNTELAEQAGLRCDDGIVVNAFNRTSHPSVFALGDCCRFPSSYAIAPVRLESVQNAIDQAKSTAANLLGANVPYNAVPWFWSDQGELKLQTAGLGQGADSFVMRGSPEQCKFTVFHIYRGRIVAADSVNAPAEHMLSRRFIGARAHPALADTGFDLKSLLPSPSNTLEKK